jgi:type IV pilus secretin PilQ/predicted competence protein
MMRSAKRLGVVCGGLLVAVAGLSGCAPPSVPLDETTRTEVGTAGVEDLLARQAGVPGGLEVLEIKVVDDNGQQGVFAKLSRPPREVSHFTVGGPNRLVIEVFGATASGISAEQYPVDNPLIEQVSLGSDGDKIRITLKLRGESIPAYTVDDLNDTLVAFLGEPSGTSRSIREQIVFTRRALPGGSAPQPPARVAAAERPEAASPPPVIRVYETPTRPGETTTISDPPLQTGRTYYGQPISLDLKDADIHNVLRLLAGVSELNVIATDDVQGRITLRLSEVPWDQALDLILTVMNLEKAQEGNVIRISTVKRLREEREELKRAQDAAQQVELLQVAYMRVNYATATKIAELISGIGPQQQLLQQRGGRGLAMEEMGVLSPRGSVLVDEFTNTLIVRDIQRGIDSARELVRQLDIQTPQVLIESKIVEATTDFARELGVQWGYRSSIGPQTGTSTGLNFPGMIGFGGSGLGAGTGGVPFLVDFPAGGAFGPGSGSALDLALGSLDGSQSLDVRLTALEQRGKGRIISRPRVVTLNNVPATIKSLTILRVRLPSTGTVINTGAGGQAGAQQTATEQIETGIILTVVPQVSSDGYVLLDMFVKSSQADFARTVDNIPTEITREATSHILVRDGETVVLGGIYRDVVSDNEEGLPFFNQIPGLRWLFRSESKAKRREDLLVFLTPRSLKASRTAGDLPSAAELWENRGDVSVPADVSASMR